MRKMIKHITELGLLEIPESLLEKVFAEVPEILVVIKYKDKEQRVTIKNMNMIKVSILDGDYSNKEAIIERGENQIDVVISDKE
jgi:hypothetical protein